MKNVSSLRTKDQGSFPISAGTRILEEFPSVGAPATKTRIHSRQEPKAMWGDHRALEFLSFLGEEGYIHMN